LRYFNSGLFCLTRTTLVALAVFALTTVLLLPVGVFAATTEQEQALARINSYRARAAVPPLALNESLNQAASAHANYFVINAGDLGGISPHSEIEGKPGFTGVSSWDRAQRFGYPSVGRWRENMHYLANPVAAVDDWMNSVFHRFAVLDPNLREMGFAVAAGNGRKVDVLDTAAPVYTENASAVVVYPAPNQTDVPLAFDGRESPDPLLGAAYPTGYPITAMFGGGNVQIAEALLRDFRGNPVDSYVLYPGSGMMDNSVAVVAKQPLRAAEKYTVSLSGTTAGTAFSRNWSFTTTVARVASSTGEIQGRVISKRTRRAIRRGVVRIDNSIVRTNRRGTFRFTLVHPGVYTIHYSAPGFRPQTQVIEVRAGQATRPPTVLMGR
jgi:uncharacterized protein YkwD